MNKICVYTDGGVDAANKTISPCYCSFVAFDADGNHVGSMSDVSKGTSNEAEYKGLLFALMFLQDYIDLKDISIEFISDSKLLVSQMNGEWRVKDDKLKILHSECHSLVRAYKQNGASITFTHVRREHNKITDALCNLTKQKIIKNSFSQTLNEFATKHNLIKNKVFKTYVEKVEANTI